MRGLPTSHIRAPLFSRVAIAASLSAGAALVACIAAIERDGFVRHALAALALTIMVVGGRWAWRVASRETERLR